MSHYQVSQEEGGKLCFILHTPSPRHHTFAQALYSLDSATDPPRSYGCRTTDSCSRCPCLIWLASLVDWSYLLWCVLWRGTGGGGWSARLEPHPPLHSTLARPAAVMRSGLWPHQVLTSPCCTIYLAKIMRYK
jgi:hypothetical protein